MKPTTNPAKIPVMDIKKDCSTNMIEVCLDVNPREESMEISLLLVKTEKRMEFIIPNPAIISTKREIITAKNSFTAIAEVKELLVSVQDIVWASICFIYSFASRGFSS